jgi:hypothetical protein
MERAIILDNVAFYKSNKINNKNPELWMGGNYDCKNSRENCKKLTFLI